MNKIVKSLKDGLMISLLVFTAFVIGLWSQPDRKIIPRLRNEPYFKIYPVRHDIDCIVIDYKDNWRVTCFKTQRDNKRITGSK